MVHEETQYNKAGIPFGGEIIIGIAILILLFCLNHIEFRYWWLWGAFFLAMLAMLLYLINTHKNTKLDIAFNEIGICIMLSPAKKSLTTIYWKQVEQLSIIDNPMKDFCGVKHKADFTFFLMKSTKAVKLQLSDGSVFIVGTKFPGKCQQYYLFYREFLKS